MARRFAGTLLLWSLRIVVITIFVGGVHIALAAVVAMGSNIIAHGTQASPLEALARLFTSERFWNNVQIVVALFGVLALAAFAENDLRARKQPADGTLILLHQAFPMLRRGVHPPRSRGGRKIGTPM